MTNTAHWFEPHPEARAAWAEWLDARPPNVREVAERFPPWTLWRMHHLDDAGNPTERFQRVYVQSFGEQDDNTVTLTVAVDGRFNCVAFERAVFGIDPARLKPTTLPGPDEIVGSADMPIEQAIQMMKRDQS